MIAPFDILRTNSNGDLRWIEAVADLNAAKARLRTIGLSSPGTYMIVCHVTGNKLYFDVDSQGVVTARTASFTT